MLSLNFKIYWRALGILLAGLWSFLLLSGLPCSFEMAEVCGFVLASAGIALVIAAPSFLVYCLLMPVLCRLSSDRTTRILLAILAAFLASFTHTIALLFLNGGRGGLYGQLPLVLILLGLGTVPATIAILTCYKEFSIAHF